tara:strand:+ start:1284 stop:3254 length:1971 start_codon:yes stop_codon:yes gene_type:complete
MKSGVVLIAESVTPQDKEVKLPKPGTLQSQLSNFTTQRQRFTRVWDMCSLFLQGRQHIRWDKNLKNFIGIPMDRKRSRATFNLIINIYRNLLARLTIAYPAMTVMPSSPSTEDIMKSEASETFLRYYWHTEDMKSVLTTLLEWLLVAGNAGLHTFYDPEDDKIHTRVVSPYDLYFEPGATKVEESRYCAIRHIVHKDDLIAAYPDKAEIIKKSGDKPQRTFRTFFQASSGTDSNELKDRLEVFEVYMKTGEMGMLLGTNWLYKSKWPVGKSPITIVQYTKMPGRLYGMGMIEPLIELQTMYNRGRTQIIQNAELMGNPKWLVPKSSGVAKDALSDSRPGEKVVYNAASGPAPSQVAAAPLPGYVLDNIRQLSSEMHDVAGVHSTSLGKRAIGIESGAAIESLTNRDSQQLLVTQHNIEEAVKDVALCVLEMARKFYTRDRMIRMMDNTGRVVHKVLNSTDLCHDAEIYLESGSMFRDEKKDRDQRVLEMVKLGLLDKEEALRALDYRTGNARVTRKMAGFSHAHDMLEAVIAGREIEIMPTDDLKAFQEVFEGFMRTEPYYRLPEETQNYIRDVLVAVATFGKEDEDFVRQELERTVFPRMPKKPDDAAGMMTSVSSPGAAAQMADQYSSLDERRAVTDDAKPILAGRAPRMGGVG